jgi:short-subunit dehydrogenase
VKIDRAVAIVTGASRGIGRATVLALHARGATVGLVARSGSELEELAQPYASMLEEAPDTFERLMRVNYLGTVYATLAVLDSMVHRHKGHIVKVASVAGRLGAPFGAAYSASKFAVVGMSEALAAEVHPFGVAVSLVNPGPVDTDFTNARGVPFQRSVPRSISPDRVAALVVRAIEDDRFEQTIPRWLRSGSIARAMAPNLYRKGLFRDSAKEGASLVHRMEGRKT